VTNAFIKERMLAIGRELGVVDSEIEGIKKSNPSEATIGVRSPAGDGASREARVVLGAPSLCLSHLPCPVRWAVC